MNKLCFLLLLLANLSAFEPFTGKITRDRVRMRLMPQLDSQILKEFDKNELVLVTGETEEYFAIQPPQDVKAYVFRTFVLDGIVEGNHVNVRLAPSLEAPIIGQLAEKERVEGILCQENPKWLEITPPKTVQFFVYKDYIEKAEMESLTKGEEIEEEPLSFEQFVFEELKEEKETKTVVVSAFEPKEKALFEAWKGTKEVSLEEFYAEQKKHSKTLSGIVKPFSAEVCNKPGDYLLLNPITMMPVGYLYSTLVPLNELVGKEVTLQVASRGNNDFALPAYAVLEEKQPLSY